LYRRLRYRNARIRGRSRATRPSFTVSLEFGEQEGSAQLSSDTCIVVTALIDGGDLSGRGRGRLPASASSARAAVCRSTPRAGA